MILLPNFLGNEFRDCNRLIFYTYVYRDMKNGTSPFLVEWLPRNNFDFIWFSYLTSLTFIQVYIWRLRRVLSVLRGNLARPHKRSKVELIYRACVKRKHFIPVMDTTWMVPGHLKHIYLSGALVTVDDVRPIYPPPPPRQTFDINWIKLKVYILAP